jgi:hypothetical protein
MKLLLAGTLVAATAVGASAVQAGGGNNTCRALPNQTCWSNPGGKIASLPGMGSDPQICCDACASNVACAAWNHGAKDSKTGTFTCDLYRDEGPTKISSDGCSGGFGTHHEPVPRGDKPNIVFLVVESTDGRTWQRGYSNDLIPMPAVRGLQENGVSFHRHYSNAPVCWSVRSLGAGMCWSVTAVTVCCVEMRLCACLPSPLQRSHPPVFISARNACLSPAFHTCRQPGHHVTTTVHVYLHVYLPAQPLARHVLVRPARAQDPALLCSARRAAGAGRLEQLRRPASELHAAD